MLDVEVACHAGFFFELIKLAKILACILDDDSEISGTVCAGVADVLSMYLLSLGKQVVEKQAYELCLERKR